MPEMPVTSVSPQMTVTAARLDRPTPHQPVRKVLQITHERRLPLPQTDHLMMTTLTKS